MIIADYDPGTLTGFYIMVLTAGIVIICLFVAGVSLCMKSRRIAIRSVIMAVISLLVGLCMASCIVWLSKKGIIHLL
jgi:hypothetical protein